MVAFPNCKINIGLHILHKRNDGYHEVETCMYPVLWEDVLEIIPSERETAFSVTGTEELSAGPDNLCIRAYELLKREFGLPPVHMHLHKILPFGAGIGGGSSDAAHTLKILNSVFRIGLENRQLEEYAARLGSDCPFFIRNSPALASGRGEQLREISLSLSGTHIIIIFPGFGISTAEAYAGVTPSGNRPELQGLLNTPKGAWKNVVENDFEKGLFPRYPVLSGLKQNLYEAGAFYASMSGSGSAIYGLFESPPSIKEWKNFRSYTGVLQ